MGTKKNNITDIMKIIIIPDNTDQTDNNKADNCDKDMNWHFLGTPNEIYQIYHRYMKNALKEPEEPVTSPVLSLETLLKRS